MSDSDYYLTGLLTCPHCGHKYIGTSAKGRNRTYRYYTCFSRIRYGTAGCHAARLPADQFDQAVLQALYDFYTTAEPILAAMIERARSQHHDTHADRRAELDAITAQITTAEHAVDKYHTAFENGTMDDATAGPRIKDLRVRVEQLHARHAEITDQLDTQPTAPPPGTIQRLRAYLHQVTTVGTTSERKAAIETLIADIKITDQGVIPVFKIPTDETPPAPPNPDEGHHNEQQPLVRTMVRSVGRTGLEPVTDGL
jgi:site-specific DNA recombinase